MITVEDVRAYAMTLPRTTEALVHDRVKFHRLHRLLAQRDGDGLRLPEGGARGDGSLGAPQVPHARHVRSPLPVARVRTDAIDEAEMRELVLDAWRMVVPKRVAAAHDGET
jgi:hypothetical protein